MDCRPGCGACCIAPSITSPIPGMPAGKPAGSRCIQLTAAGLCSLFGAAERPAVCQRFAATEEQCGNSNAEAMHYLTTLEQLTC